MVVSGVVVEGMMVLDGVFVEGSVFVEGRVCVGAFIVGAFIVELPVIGIVSFIEDPGIEVVV